MGSIIQRSSGVLMPQSSTPPQPGVSTNATIYHDANLPNTASVIDPTGLKCGLPKVLKRVFSIVNFGATASELVGISFTGIPAGDLVQGRILRVRLWGVGTNIGTASTMTLRCRIGTGAVNAPGGAASSNAVAASVALITAAAAKTSVPWTYGADVAIYTAGSSGTMLGQCNYEGGPAGAIAQTGAGLTAAAAINTTLAQNLDFTLQAGSATDITQTSVHGGSLEIL